MKKEFMINGQITKVDLQTRWTGFEKGKKYNGDCVKSGEELIGYFVFDGKIFVFINNNVFDVDDVKITNQLVGEYRTLTITADSKILFKTEYRALTIYEYDINEEDADDFLWISEVLNDAERRKVVLKYCIDSKVA